MLRRIITLFTTAAVLLGSVGAPVTVHACSMEGNAVKPGVTCSMCVHDADANTRLPKTTAKKDGKSCCHNERRLLQIDPARSTDASHQFAVFAVMVPAVFSPVFSQPAVFAPLDHVVDHPPPSLATRNARTWLTTSRLLI